MGFLKKLVLSASIVSAGVAMASSAQAKDLRWKMPVAFSTKLPGLGSPAAWVADNLNASSGGTIKVKVFEPKTLVPPFEIAL